MANQGVSVLPVEIAHAANEGDKARVIARLVSGGSIDARCDRSEGNLGSTLIINCVCGLRGGVWQNEFHIGDRQLALARELVLCGANVNTPEVSKGDAPLHCLLRSTLHGHRERRGDPPQASLDMLSLLLKAPGSNINVRNEDGETPLYLAITGQEPSELSVTLVTELLRAGVSLDACLTGGGQTDRHRWLVEIRLFHTAEDILQDLESEWFTARHRQDWQEGGFSISCCLFDAIKALVHGVREHGSYKCYARRLHRDVLAVRGLALRGKLSTEDPVLKFLVSAPLHGVCWKILSYWRATD